MNPAAFGMAQVKLLHGAGHADITEPAFFLEPLRVLCRHAVREQSLLHAADEHQRKLQPLGGMHGHQLDTVVPALALGLPGLEGGMAQE